MILYLPVQLTDNGFYPLDACTTEAVADQLIAADAARENLKISDYATYQVKLNGPIAFTLAATSTRWRRPSAAKGSFLNITPEGYGNQLSLDLSKGELRLLTNFDHDIEEAAITVLKPEPKETASGA